MKKIAVILCLLWMGVIFYNSSRSGIISNEKSVNLLNDAKSIYHLTKPNYASKNQPSKQTNTSSYKNIEKLNPHQQKLNLILRKNAHAFEYIVLAILVCNVFFIYKYKGKGAVVYVLFICLFYAVTDEFHQLFVPGRTSLVSDVLIDFMGALIGLGLYYFSYYKIYRRFSKNNHSY